MRGLLGEALVTQISMSPLHFETAYILFYNMRGLMREASVTQMPMPPWHQIQAIDTIQFNFLGKI